MSRNHLPRAGVAKLNGKRPWRVVGERDIPIRLKSGKPLDRGGYDSAAAANAQAFAFNEAVERNASARARAGITKRQRVEMRRAAKAHKTMNAAGFPPGVTHVSRQFAMSTAPMNIVKHPMKTDAVITVENAQAPA